MKRTASPRSGNLELCIPHRSTNDGFVVVSHEFMRLMRLQSLQHVLAGQQHVCQGHVAVSLFSFASTCIVRKYPYITERRVPFISFVNALCAFADSSILQVTYVPDISRQFPASGDDGRIGAERRWGGGGSSGCCGYNCHHDQALHAVHRFHCQDVQLQSFSQRVWALPM